MQADYVLWMDLAHKLRGLQSEKFKVSNSDNAQKLYDLKIQPLQLPVFKGDSREYARFRREFSDTVEKRFGGDQVRCMYLQNQCLKGTAKELVRGLSSFKAVTERLDSRYGRPSVIIGEVLQELETLR